MSISQYIKKIGRGRKGSSDLSRDEARELFALILADQVSDLELGAFCLAMRIKGETAQELAGFYDALQVYLPKMSFTKPVLLLPSYNGARKTHLMTPLLARHMADKGFLVLVHGVHEELRRTSSAEVFERMSWPVVKNLHEFQNILETEKMVYCGLEILCPPLAKLLNIRQVIGLRNSGHVLAKLINPVQSESLQICNYTHPEYPDILRDFFELYPANVFCMRGHEGEPVSSPQRLPEIEFFDHRNDEGKEQKQSPKSSTKLAAYFSQDPFSYPESIDAISTEILYRKLRSGEYPPLQTLVQLENLIQIALTHPESFHEAAFQTA